MCDTVATPFPQPFDLVWAKGSFKYPWWPAWVIDIHSCEQAFKGIPIPEPPDEFIEQGRTRQAGSFAVLYFHQDYNKREWLVVYLNIVVI